MTFPVYPTSFIGRNEDLQQLVTRVRQKSFRLLTLTGPGGIGKTRLAQEILSSGVEVYEDGIFWIDLTDVSDPGGIALAVGSALGLSRAGGSAEDQTLLAYLKPREVLIVLDNCEHLVRAITRLCIELLDTCPTLHLLATSREHLDLPEEETWPVPPLSHPTDSPRSLEELAKYDAVTLFTARAGQVDPAFTLAEQDFEPLVRIQMLLEGLPLAVELAAAWANVLTLADMADRLERHPGFLEKRIRQPDVRHHSLQETIRWSYDLLSPDEQTLFRCLAIFSGSFSAEAVEEICGPEAGADHATLLLLGRLIDQSLVFRERSGTDESRFRMLEPIRQFAREELSTSSIQSPLRTRHTTYFVDLARRAEPHLVGPDQKRWTDRLDADHENMLAALSALIKAADQGLEPLDTAVRTANRLFWVWNYTERFQEAISWFRKLRRKSGFQKSTPPGADLIRHIGTFTWLMGDYAAARAVLGDAVETARSLDYPFCMANAQLIVGLMSVHEERSGEAIALLEECVAIFESIGEARGLAISLTNLGAAHLGLGEMASAEEHLARAVRLTSDQGDIWGLGLALMVQSDVIFQTRRPKQALERIEDAIEQLASTGQDWLVSEALWRKASMLAELEEYEEAVQSLETCFNIAQEIGAVEWQVAALETLGKIHLKQGRHANAAGYFRQVLRLTEGERYARSVLKVIGGIPELAVASGQWETAAVMLAAVDALNHPARNSRDHETLKVSVRQQLEPAVHKAMLRQGGNLSLKEAADLAFEVLDTAHLLTEPAEPKVDLSLVGLGPAEVHLGGRQLVPADWTFAKPKELLFYLASSPPKTKEQIGLVFWPDASPSQLRVSLRASLYHLRKALVDRSWIIYENGTYTFNRDKPYRYDLEDFEEHLERGARLSEADTEAALGHFLEAVRLYRGDFLTGIASDEWAVLRRENLRESFLGTLEAIGRLSLQTGDHKAALEAYQKLFGEEPLREEASRGLMRVYVAIGERAMALQQYQLLKNLLTEELGVEPSQETKSLYTILI